MYNRLHDALKTPQTKELLLSGSLLRVLSPNTLKTPQIGVFFMCVEVDL